MERGTPVVKVFKFGGASVRDAAAVRNVAEIIRRYPDDSLVVIVSAMGKITNALEALLNAYVDNTDERWQRFDEIRDFHLKITGELFPDSSSLIYRELENVFSVVTEKLQTRPSENYDYEYDQMVSLGEILSSLIVNAYLNEAGLTSVWLDARSLIRTDNTYRDARILWHQTETGVRRAVDFAASRIYLTQGFIGSTLENLVTTLGREGSDYSAAIAAYCLDAADVTIWKDVPGVLNADPKWFDDTVKIDELTYHDAIELAYYGASVIHPKTIKPLQNKNIPLWVKSFVDPAAVGTVVRDGKIDKTIPSFIFKVNQTLVTVSPKDFSFIVEENLRDIFQIFSELRVRINMMQNTAISFSVSIDTDERKFGRLIRALEDKFRVRYNTGMELVTIRHYDQETIDRVTAGKEILLEEKSRHTVQLVMRNRG